MVTVLMDIWHNYKDYLIISVTCLAALLFSALDKTNLVIFFNSLKEPMNTFQTVHSLQLDMDVKVKDLVSADPSCSASSVHF